MVIISSLNSKHQPSNLKPYNMENLSIDHPTFSFQVHWPPLHGFTLNFSNQCHFAYQFGSNKGTLYFPSIP